MPFPAVIDLSHYAWSGIAKPDLVAAREVGVVAIIYKATEGSTYKDPRYAETRALAKSAGLLWGAFHFGTAAPVDAQIANFFATAEPDDDTLMCLDFERNGPAAANTMGGAAAIDFMTKASARLNRDLVIYTGSHMAEAFGAGAVPALAKYRLWWAEYGVAAPKLHATWAHAWLWQYTQAGKVGTIDPCDCSTYAGDLADLKVGWT